MRKYFLKKKKDCYTKHNGCSGFDFFNYRNVFQLQFVFLLDVDDVFLVIFFSIRCRLFIFMKLPKQTGIVVFSRVNTFTDSGMLF